ncbi:MAG: invasin domain 3-containing protein [Balneolaceae bacterium]
MNLRISTALSTLLMLTLGMLAGAAVSDAQQVQPTTPVIISADNVGGTYNTLMNGPVITETSAGQVVLGEIRFNAPSGFEWDTGGTTPAVAINVAPGFNGNTKLAIQYVSRTASTITFQVTSTSNDPPRRAGQATFSNFRLRPTSGTHLGDFNVTASGPAIAVGSTSFAQVTKVAGADAGVRVESAPDGSGSLVAFQELPAGNSLDVYAVVRDQFNNFKSPGSATWDLTNITGEIQQADLVAAGDGEAATMIGARTGTANIRAQITGLTPFPSGEIEVVPAEATRLVLTDQPSDLGASPQYDAGEVMDLFRVEVHDNFGNRVTDGVARTVTAARLSGSGTLQGTTSLENSSAQYDFNDLFHTLASEIDLRFTAPGLLSITSDPVTIVPAAADSLIFTTLPRSANRQSTIEPPPIVRLVDAWENLVQEAGRTVELNLIRINHSNGSFHLSTTSVDTDIEGRSVFDNIAVDQPPDSTLEYRLEAVSTDLQSTTSIPFIVVESGKLSRFNIWELVNGNEEIISSKTAGETFDLSIRAVDGNNNLIDEFNGEVTLSTTGTLSGATNTTIPFTDGIATHPVALIESGTHTVFVVNNDGPQTGTSNEFTVSAAAADPDSSIITIDTDTLIADGSSEAEVTVQLRDEFGNPIEDDQNLVQIFDLAAELTISTPVYTGNGTWSATITAPGEVGNFEIGASVNSQTITSGNVLVNFTFGALTTFLVEAETGGTIGEQTAGVIFPIRITALDAFDNIVESFDGSGATTVITSSGTISSGSGTTATFTEGVLNTHSVTLSSAGNFSISARRSGFSESGTSELFTVVAGPASTATTTITPATSFLQNDGTDNTTITVEVRDAFGNLRTQGDDTVTLDDGGSNSSLSAVTNQGGGIYTATLTAGMAMESVTVTGTVNSSAITNDAVISVTQFNTWTSAGGNPANSRIWEQAGNWELGVPTTGQVVIIPTNPAESQNFPLIDELDVEIDFLVIHQDATINLNSGRLLTIHQEISGSGTLIADEATVELFGPINIKNITAGTSDIYLERAGGLTISDSTNLVGDQIFIQSDVVNEGYLEASLNLSVNTGQTLNNETGSELVMIDQITIDGNLSGNGSTFRFGGSIDATTSNILLTDTDVEFNGTAAQEVSGFSPIHNLTINNGVSVTFNNDLVVNGTLTLQNGLLDIPSGYSLVANNKSGTTENLRMQREISGNRGWRLLGSPIISSVSDLLGGTLTQGYPGADLYDTESDTLQPNVLWYQESHPGTDNQRWRAPADASDTVTPGRGYFVYFFGDIPEDNRYNDPLPQTLEVTGEEHDGNGTEVALPVTYTAVADTGWNLVANPFAAAIDWDDGTWQKTNMNNTIYVWDETSGQYLTWNGSAGSLGSGKIAPFQGFWVKANGNGAPSLRVRKVSKTTGGTFYRESAEPESPPVIALELTSDGLSQSTHFSFTEGGSNKLDDQDAYRLLPFGTDTWVEVYSLLDDGTELAIRNLPRRFGRTIEIPIQVGGVRNGNWMEGEATLSWPELENLPQEWSLRLIDRNTGGEVDMRQNSWYDFTLSSAGAAKPHVNRPGSFSLVRKITGLRSEARFVMVIDPGADAAGIPDHLVLQSNYPNPFAGSTTLRYGLPVETDVRIEIYDILGRRVQTVLRGRQEAGYYELPWNGGSIASGVYFVRLVTSEGVLNRKMTRIE